MKTVGANSTLLPREDAVAKYNENGVISSALIPDIAGSYLIVETQEEFESAFGNGTAIRLEDNIVIFLKPCKYGGVINSWSGNQAYKLKNAVKIGTNVKVMGIDGNKENIIIARDETQSNPDDIYFYTESRGSISSCSNSTAGKTITFASTTLSANGFEDGEWIHYNGISQRWYMPTANHSASTYFYRIASTNGSTSMTLDRPVESVKTGTGTMNLCNDDLIFYNVSLDGRGNVFSKGPLSGAVNVNDRVFNMMSIPYVTNSIMPYIANCFCSNTSAACAVIHGDNKTYNVNINIDYCSGDSSAQNNLISSIPNSTINICSCYDAGVTAISNIVNDCPNSKITVSYCTSGNYYCGASTCSNSNITISNCSGGLGAVKSCNSSNIIVSYCSNDAYGVRNCIDSKINVSHCSSSNTIILYCTDCEITANYCTQVNTGGGIGLIQNCSACDISVSYCNNATTGGMLDTCNYCMITGNYCSVIDGISVANNCSYSFFRGNFNDNYSSSGSIISNCTGIYMLQTTQNQFWMCSEYKTGITI